jgi:hypothetical protein
MRALLGAASAIATLGLCNCHFDHSVSICQVHCMQKGTPSLILAIVVLHPMSLALYRWGAVVQNILLLASDGIRPTPIADGEED